MLLLFVAVTVTAQSPVDVKGVVTDETGAPMIGVAVFVEGTTNGTMTDEAGAYSIKVPSSEAVLRFEMMGYKAIQAKVGNKSTLSVQMQPDTQFLEEVVVIGFGEKKKSDLTGSVVNVKMNDVLDSPLTSVDQALQGKVAGVDIITSSGDPTAGTSIRIRGSRSINASNEPLIVVDGVINAVQDLGDLNSADIESISVLKDASSTAIYGAQGANGVIIVTMKQGSETSHKPIVTATIKAGFSQLAHSLDIMNAEEFARYNNERIDFTKSYPAKPSYPNKYIDPEGLGEGTDWMKAVTRIAPTQTYALSLTGNTKKTNYFTSLSYLDNQGIVIDSGMQRVNGQFNISHKFNKWLRLRYSMNLMYRKNNNNKANIAGTSPWNGVIYMSPVLNTESTVNDLYNYGTGTKFNNPYISIMQSTNYRESFASTNSVTLELTPVKGLTIKSQNTYYLYQTHLYKYNPSTLPKKNDGDGGDLQRNEHDTRQFSSDNTITWKKDFRGHNLDVMGGASVYYNHQNDVAIEAKGILTDEVKWNDLSAISDKQNYKLSSYNTKVKRLSFLARANYNFRNRYYVTFTGRADGSSNFAANRKWGFFPSFALKWNLANESWLKRTRKFQDLSLRFSAGRTGNDAISAYSSLAAYDSASTGYLFDGTQSTYFFPNRLASPNLTWETTDLYNLALDVAVLKGRLKFTLEGYLSYTTDLLLKVQKASQTGYTSFMDNIGKTSNKGLEFSIESRNIVKKNFSWTTDFTISHNRQMVDDIGSEDFVSVMNFKDYMMYGYVKGYPLNSLWGFQYGGVFHNQGEIDENELTRQYAGFYAEKLPGHPKYVDQNHDGVLNSDDLVYLGNSDPVVYGGLQNNFHIYGFDLGIYFTYSIGGSIYNYPEFYMSATYCTNQYRYMMDAWHPVRNPNSDIPAAGGVGYSHLPSSFQVHDASYLRLKTLSLGYTFDLAKKTKFIRSLKLSMNADNVFLVTNYNGFDPDVSVKQSDETHSTLRRVDTGAYPRARTFIFMAQLKF